MKRLCVLILALCMIFTLSSCDVPTIILFSESNKMPEETLSEFIDCLGREDYEGADQLVQNFETLGFENMGADQRVSEFYKILSSSRSFNVIGGSEIDGLDATMSVDFSTFDLRIFENKLADMVKQELDDEKYFGVDINDGLIEQVMDQQMGLLLAQADQCVSTNRFSLEFKLEERIWKLVCGEDFYSALIGYA